MNSGEIILNSAEQKINKNKKDSEQWISPSRHKQCQTLGYKQYHVFTGHRITPGYYSYEVQQASASC
jgi:hypothetical protein